MPLDKGVDQEIRGMPVLEIDFKGFRRQQQRRSTDVIRYKSDHQPDKYLQSLYRGGIIAAGSSAPHGPPSGNERFGSVCEEFAINRMA